MLYLEENSSYLVDSLLDLGVSYCSLTILDLHGNSSFSKSSSDKWHRIYIESDLFKGCHLMKEAAQQLGNATGGFSFVWDNYKAINEESLYLNQLRKENNIDHGVALCSPLSGGNFSILTVAGGRWDVNFAKNALVNKQLIYKAVMSALLSNKQSSSYSAKRSY